MKISKWLLFGAAFVLSILYPILYAYQASVELDFRINNSLSTAWDFTHLHYNIAIFVTVVIIITFVLTAVKMTKKPRIAERRNKVVIVFKTLGVCIMLFVIFLYIAGFLRERYDSTLQTLYWFPYYMYGCACGATGALLYLIMLVVNKISASKT